MNRSNQELSYSFTPSETNPSGQIPQPEVDKQVSQAKTQARISRWTQ
ncbi:MAG: hypothetical protein RIB93_04355 [Coleofasciculus sp. D1-CHI-01]